MAFLSRRPLPPPIFDLTYSKKLKKYLLASLLVRSGAYKSILKMRKRAKQTFLYEIFGDLLPRPHGPCEGNDSYWMSPMFGWSRLFLNQLKISYLCLIPKMNFLLLLNMVLCSSNRNRKFYGILQKIFKIKICYSLRSQLYPKTSKIFLHPSQVVGVEYLLEIILCFWISSFFGFKIFLKHFLND